jgi:hypothetical protein
MKVEDNAIHQVRSRIRDHVRRPYTLGIPYGLRAASATRPLNCPGKCASCAGTTSITQLVGRPKL